MAHIADVNVAGTAIRRVTGLWTNHLAIHRSYVFKTNSRTVSKLARQASRNSMSLVRFVRMPWLAFPETEEYYGGA